MALWDVAVDRLGERRRSQPLLQFAVREFLLKGVARHEPAVDEIVATVHVPKIGPGRGQ
jgi:hypothetical protein